ncbi:MULTISPECIES: FecR family protein [Vreelandella]|uniref:LysM peptidoglycan-binding domain-containing protein n=2 Tax=Vreelandella TaxID=3137766 RepID=A0A7C9K8D8_9GAMM|nr:MULTISPECIES: FecR domain-containing protein [Halomonas]NDL72201.1 LysM peptidoglycan-binding domain-containing protein [Halomonas alkaliphila]NYS46564.1 FecR domain-containing protein [Halomonas zhaodongensis]
MKRCVSLLIKAPMRRYKSRYKSGKKTFLHYAALVSAILMLGTSVNASEPSDGYHRVVPGDTLWDISERYYGTPNEWPLLQQLNTISQPTKLQPNTVVDLGAFDPFPLTVLYRSGEVWIVEEANEIHLTRGDTVHVGATVQTGAGSSVTLQMRDGARAVVPSNSRVVLQREGERGITFYLEEGEVESYVPPNRTQRRAYNIETNAGVLGVRGTHFRARYVDNTLLTAVYDGNVSAQSRISAEQASVSRDEGARISTAGDIRVVPLLPPPDDVQITSFAPDGIQANVLSPRPGATYRAQIADDPDFLNILQEQRSRDGQHSFTGLMPGFYHLRVSAVDELGIEGRSAAFVVLHNDHRVSVVREGGAWIFEWAYLAQQTYRLQLAEDSEFSTILLNYEAKHRGPLKVSRLPESVVYWRVVSENERTGVTEVIDAGTLNGPG